jgi:hypothetical protein
MDKQNDKRPQPTPRELALLAIHIKDAPPRRREPDITRLRELMRVMQRDDQRRYA